MINAQELRIGNLLMRYSNIMEVSGIANDQVDLILLQPNTRVKWRMLYSDIFGIPLTEEWVTNFGFVKLYHLSRHEHVLYVDDKLNIEFIDGYGLRIVVSNENNDVNTNTAVFVCYYEKPYIKYVHQLQNLYYTLTGQELKKVI